MTNKPTPIDLAEYVKHTVDCQARYFYVKPTPDPEYSESTYGECTCGLFDLLDALSIRKHDLQEYY